MPKSDFISLYDRYQVDWGSVGDKGRGLQYQINHCTQNHLVSASPWFIFLVFFFLRRKNNFIKKTNVPAKVKEFLLMLFLKKKKKVNIELGHALPPPPVLLTKVFVFKSIGRKQDIFLRLDDYILLLLCLVYIFLNWEKKSRWKNYLTRKVVYMVITLKLLPKEKKCKKNLKCKISHNFKKKTYLNFLPCIMY